MIKCITLHNVENLYKERKWVNMHPTEEEDIFSVTDEAVIIRLSDDTSFLIKKGWEYDGATVPLIIRWAFPKWGKYSVPSLVHDILYYYREYKDRQFADKEHMIWCKAMRISILQRELRYLMLRIFAGYYWKKSKKHPSKRCIRNRKLTSYAIIKQ